MKIIITSATELEVAPLKALVEKHAVKNVHFHVSGVGILQSCFSIQKMILEDRPDFILQAGIAGTFHEHGLLGEVVVVKEEVLGSCGVEENGQWKDIFDLDLRGRNSFPFQDTGLKNPFLETQDLLQLPQVKAVTVDEVSTAEDRIVLLRNKYDPCLESMEGASLHYCALQYAIPFLQVRGISNYVGQRDKRSWKIKEAVLNTCEKVFALTGALNG